MCSFLHRSRGIRVGAVCLFLGIVVHVISYASTEWVHFTTTDPGDATNKTIYMGLWELCNIQNDSTTCENLLESLFLPSWIPWVQALNTVGLVLEIFSVASIVIYFYNGMRVMLVYTQLLCLIAGVIDICGAIIFGYETPRVSVLSWCYPLACIGGGLMCLASVCFTREYRRNATHSYNLISYNEIN